MTPIGSPQTPILYKTGMKKAENKLKNGNDSYKEIKKVISENIECQEDKTVAIYLTSKKIPVPDYIALFQEFSFWAGKTLTPTTCKVLFLILGKAEYANAVTFHQTTISEYLKISKETVKRAVKELTAYNVLIKSKDLQDKRVNMYIINPMSVWKGTPAKRIQAVRILERQMKLEFPTQTLALE